MYFNANLRYLRKSAGLSQDAVAEMLGYKAYTTIQKWEDGTSEPNLSVIRKLADIFHVSMDALINVDLEKMDYRNERPHEAPLGRDGKLWADILANRPEIQTLVLKAKDASDDEIKKLIKILEVL